MKITEAFTLPANTSEVYRENGMNKDIRDYMEKLFPDAVKECTWKIDAIFKGTTPLGTACLIWTFLRTRCKYRKDPDHTQIIRKPAYFVNHEPHQGDCKTFALFARAIYASIYPNLETSFCFTGYAPGATQPSHVYTKVKDENGKTIIIDGCWGFFNSEKDYSFVLPYHWRTMKITSLGDLSDEEALKREIASIKRFHPESAIRLEMDLIKLQLQRFKDDYPGLSDRQYFELWKSKKADYIAGVPPSTNQYNAYTLLNGINDNASADYRNRVSDLVSARKALQLAKIEYDGGHMSRAGYESVLGDCMRILGDKQLSGINKHHKKTAEEKTERKAKRKRKVKDFFKKFGHAAAFAVLAPVRGAFAALTAMNLNGLASNMRLIQEGRTSPAYTPAQQAHAVDGWNRLTGLWKKLGGMPKAFTKAVALGTKHKPLWFSKRAKSKFEGRATAEGDKPGSQKWLAGVDGIWHSYDESVGDPISIGTAVAAGSSALAAMLPIMMKTLGGMGHKNEANSMAASAQDLMNGGQPTAAQLAAMAVPQGDNPAAYPDADPNSETDDDDDDDVGSDDDDGIFDMLVGAVNDVLDSLTNLIPAPPAPEPGGFDWSQITGPLTKFADTGLHLAATAIERKVSSSPKMQQVFGKGNLDTLFTGAHLHAAGDPYSDMYKHKRKKKKGFGLDNKTMLIGGAALAAIFVVSQNSGGNKK